MPKVLTDLYLYKQWIFQGPLAAEHQEEIRKFIRADRFLTDEREQVKRQLHLVPGLPDKSGHWEYRLYLLKDEG